MSLQREFAKPKSERHCEERRPDSVGVPHHCSGSGDQVSDTPGVFVCVCVSIPVMLFVYDCVSETCLWSQGKLLAVGADVRIHVGICGSAVEQVRPSLSTFGRETSHST